MADYTCQWCLVVELLKMLGKLSGCRLKTRIKLASQLRMYGIWLFDPFELTTFRGRYGLVRGTNE